MAAASEDPRFLPVRADELDALSYSVDVLFTPMPVASVDDLDPSRYGVIVAKGARRGLLLPNLKGVKTASEQVAIAKCKAGIDPDDDVELARFEVVRHEGESRAG
ncbi:MAG: AMMECR1 domain-containing protein [Eggerthellaceae bacterium]